MRNQYRNLLRNKKNNYFTIALASDIHIDTAAIDNTSYPNLSSPPMFYYTAGSKMQQFVDHVIENKPDAAVFLGDCIEAPNYDASFDLFMSKWNQIPSSIPKVVAAGNHDYTGLIPSSGRHEYVAGKLGYGSNPIVAGSKMNVSFAVNNPLVDVRFINFESNMTSSGLFNSAGGFYSSDMIEWIRNEILSCNENIIILTTHKYRNHIDLSEKTKLEVMLQEVVSIRPEVKPYILFGHSHIWKMYKMRSEVGNFEIFNCSALVDNAESEFYTLKIDKGGIRGYDTHWAVY